MRETPQPPASGAVRVLSNRLGNEMIDSLLFALTIFSTLGCGLIAGVFFAFSAFVMNALARLPPSAGHCRNAIHQCRGDQSLVLGGVFGNGRGLRASGCLLPTHVA